MKRFGLHAALVVALLIVLGVGSYAIAGGNSKNLRTDRMIGYNEVPAVSTLASGTFRATLDRNANTISYTMTYAGLEGAVTQAHIHFGQRFVASGVSLWLCSNVATPPTPPGTQPCPPSPATVSGVLDPADVVGPTGQGIAPGEWEEIESAIRAGMTYVNVHSTKFPGGEIRAQINSRGEDDD